MPRYSSTLNEENNSWCNRSQKVRKMNKLGIRNFSTSSQNKQKTPKLVELERKHYYKKKNAARWTANIFRTKVDLFGLRNDVDYYFDDDKFREDCKKDLEIVTRCIKEEKFENLSEFMSKQAREDILIEVVENWTDDYITNVEFKKEDFVDVNIETIDINHVTEDASYKRVGTYLTVFYGARSGV